MTEERTATKFAVRHRLETDVLLQLHDVTNGSIFDCVELLLGDRSLAEPVPRIDKFLRAQQATYVVRVKWWFLASCDLSYSTGFTSVPALRNRKQVMGNQSCSQHRHSDWEKKARASWKRFPTRLRPAGEVSWSLCLATTANIVH